MKKHKSKKKRHSRQKQQQKQRKQAVRRMSHVENWVAVDSKESIPDEDELVRPLLFSFALVLFFSYTAYVLTVCPFCIDSFTLPKLFIG
jgi:hypothetical protein